MGFFDSRYKFRVHLLQIIVVIAAIAVTAARLLVVKNKGTRSRANTIALGAGAKSLVIIGYQLLTEHVTKFRRWASLKANMILNIIETVFWGAVIFLIMRANINNTCSGTSCILSWVTAGLACFLKTYSGSRGQNHGLIYVFKSIVASYTAVVSILDYRHFRSTGSHRSSKVGPNSGTIEVQSPLYTRKAMRLHEYNSDNSGQSIPREQNLRR